MYVNILPQIEVRQFNDITIRNIGLADLHTVTIAPQTVSVVVNGPVASVNELTASDIQVVVDLNGLEAGQYDLAPSIEISKADLSNLITLRFPIPSRFLSKIYETLSFSMIRASTTLRPLS